MFKLELKRALTRKSTVVVLAIGILIAGLDVLTNNVILLTKQDFLDYPYGVYSWWILYDLDVYISIFMIIFPLLASVAYGDAYVEDMKSGFIKNILVRYSKKKYLLIRFIITFLVGGLVVSIPLLFNFVLYACFIPIIEPNIFFGSYSIPINGFLPELFYSHPFLHVALKIFICFIYGGIFAVISLFFSLFIFNRYIVVIIPFIIYLFLDILFSSIGVEYVSPIVFLFFNIIPYTNLIFLIAISTLVLLMISFLFGGKRYEVF